MCPRVERQGAIVKPPYVVPLVSSLVVPPDAPTVISTFSGMGGSCLGFKIAGFRHLLACEFIEEARATYAANFPGVQIASEDVRDLSVAEVLRRTGLRAGELDVLEGSPPCSSFSTAGKGAKGWGETKKYSDKSQRTDDLFFEFARLVDGLQPRAFVAENVSGLVKGAAKGYFLEILARLKAAGYDVRAQLLDAQWLGVPQARSRVIFIGTRNDLEVRPEFPKPLSYRYSIRDACPWIAEKPTVAGPSASERAEASMERFAVGVEWDKTPAGGTSKKYFSLVKADPERPCPTITQKSGDTSAASVCHPFEKRKFTVGEVKRLSGVPDDFVLTGTYRQKIERLGRCVPPIMAMHVARAVRATLEKARARGVK